MLKPILAIALGSALGALLRWELGLRLNALFPTLPLGTLAANLIGGYIIGFALAALSQLPGLAPEWRLLIVTGFCGGLTTFSTFTADILNLLQHGRLGWAVGGILIHVLSSLLMTVLGMASWQWLRW